MHLDNLGKWQLRECFTSWRELRWMGPRIGSSYSWPHERTVPIFLPEAPKLWRNNINKHTRDIFSSTCLTGQDSIVFLPTCKIIKIVFLKNEPFKSHLVMSNEFNIWSLIYEFNKFINYLIGVFTVVNFQLNKALQVENGIGPVRSDFFCCCFSCQKMDKIFKLFIFLFLFQLLSAYRITKGRKVFACIHFYLCNLVRLSQKT